MKPRPLSVDLPRIDGGTQNRVEIDEDTVEDYAQVIADNGKDWPFPPIDVFHDGTAYFVSNGFHRLLAAIRAKRGSIPCNIHKGTAEDARIHGMTANDTHGLRMTRADKRVCVAWLLDNRPKMTQKDMAATAGVSVWLVKDVVASRKPKSVRGNATPHKLGSEGRNNPEPTTSGVSEAVDDTEDPINASDGGKDGRKDSDGTEAQETPPRPPRKGKEKPGVLLTRAQWFSRWEEAIKPVVQLVDKIAEGVREKHDPHQESIQAKLEDATQEMAQWMGVTNG